MGVQISGIVPGSPAAKASVGAGDRLLAINGHPIGDVLDYRFYMNEHILQLELETPPGRPYRKTLRKGEYEEPGLLFDTYLMDKQRSCRNKCVFCFVDQMPKGMRSTLYFKDDDSRMSFLFGNYITLTNLEERDVSRILDMHISPVNVSVHTTNPELRVRMMKNPQAGQVLDYLPRLARAGIRINAQLVLCPGWNDGGELERSLSDLAGLAPSLQSVSAVPVGLTRYREGLAGLRSFTGEEAARTLDCLDRWGKEMLRLHGSRVFYGSDEFYLLAGRDLPDYEHYGEFHQLENGVGLLTLLEWEFRQALSLEDPRPVSRRVSIATGTAAAPFLARMAGEAEERFPGLQVRVFPVENRFFGSSITVAGLLTGGDLSAGLAERDLGEELLFPAVMLRHEGDLFLDDVSPARLSQQLGVPVRPVPNDGFALLDALLGQDGAGK